MLRIITKHDLSLVQMRLFGILRDHEPEMLELARYLNLDKSIVTGLIDRAERRGLVQRSSSPEDGRVFRVVVTPLGRQITDEVAAQVENEVLKLVAGLNKTDRIDLPASCLSSSHAKQVEKPISGYYSTFDGIHQSF